MYYLAFPKDRAAIKALVYTIFLISTAETIILVDGSYRMIGTGWGDDDVFLKRQAIWFMPVTASVGAPI